MYNNMQISDTASQFPSRFPKCHWWKSTMVIAFPQNLPQNVASTFDASSIMTHCEVLEAEKKALTSIPSSQTILQSPFQSMFLALQWSCMVKFCPIAGGQSAIIFLQRKHMRVTLSFLFEIPCNLFHVFHQGNWTHGNVSLAAWYWCEKVSLRKPYQHGKDRCGPGRKARSGCVTASKTTVRFSPVLRRFACRLIRDPAIPRSKNTKTLRLRQRCSAGFT